MLKDEKDWELTDEYYKDPENKKELSLEDFLTDQDMAGSTLLPPEQSDERLKKTINEVHIVLTLAQEGKSIDQIADITGFDKTYIYDIQVCAEGFREDDEIAVAHLVLG